MWICLNNAFVSAVEHNDDPLLLVVRARVDGHLETFFAGVVPVAELKVEIHPERDYLYRTIVRRHVFAAALAHHVVSGITYGNFKNSVKDDALHDAYSHVWLTMLQLQRHEQEFAAGVDSQYVPPRAQELWPRLPVDDRWHGLPDPVIEPRDDAPRGGKSAKIRPLPDADFAAFGDDALKKKPAKKPAKKGNRK